MASFIFANGKIQTQRNRYHTPATFRAQRRLRFTNPTPLGNLAAANPPPPGVSPPRASFNALPTPGNGQLSGSAMASILPFNPQPQYILPWDTPGSTTSSLYKVSPPKITYPAGSRDEEVNKRFIKEMDMHFFSNFQVRQVLVGDRPHPFLGYDRLAQYWQQRGLTDWHFDTSKTFATLQEIHDNGHTDFHQELYELLWFGGVLSYGNIMRETYAILYTWIEADVLPDLDGLCEIDDGITFRKVVIQ